MRGKALPVFLLLAFLFGLAWPELGRSAAAWRPPLWLLGGWITALIFLVSGWHLDLDGLRGQPWRGSLAAGLGLNLLGGPALGWVLLRAGSLLGLRPDLGLGLALMAAVPTTLNTGIAIAMAGGGDVALAVVLTVALSAGALLTLPLALPALAGAASDAGLAAGPLFAQLLGQAFLPLLLGQVLRQRRRPPAGLLWVPPLGVAAAVWLAVCRHQGDLPGPGWLAAALLLFVLQRGGLHLGALGLARRLRLDAAARRSFVVVSSQKSLVLASALLVQLPASLSTRLGGAAFFCVLYHLGQAFWDSALAPKAA